jgi:hypothetical protein
MGNAYRCVALVCLAVGCERAEPPPPAPALPPAIEPEPAPHVIVRDRVQVEHPPPVPPGAAWFRRLTYSEQAAVDWVCRTEARNPCYVIIPVQRRPVEEQERLAIAGTLESNPDFGRHCRQLYGPPRHCDTPLVLDVDGAPVTYIHDARAFAFGVDPVVTAWPTAATPWIAMDRDGNGVIDRGSELFRFETLAVLDANHDGVIDARDPAFASLVLWADNNADRRSTPDELTPLASVVSAIPLANRLDVRCDDGDCEGERGTAMVRDGSTAAVIDVYLRER